VSYGEYSVQEFDFTRDFLEAAQIINKSYEGFHYTEEKVKGIANSIAFDPELWVWIINKKGVKVALGIGDYYPPLKEGSLDWIQVDPNHHGKGIGKILVGELVNRILDKGSYCRVTGMNDQFYLRCGFEHDEPWFVIRR
jgi:GNAT superfamily N-acetyltransferase